MSDGANMSDGAARSSQTVRQRMPLLNRGTLQRPIALDPTAQGPGGRGLRLHRARQKTNRRVQTKSSLWPNPKRETPAVRMSASSAAKPPPRFPLQSRVPAPAPAPTQQPLESSSRWRHCLSLEDQLLSCRVCHKKQIAIPDVHAGQAPRPRPAKVARREGDPAEEEPGDMAPENTPLGSPISPSEGLSEKPTR